MLKIKPIKAESLLTNAFLFFVALAVVAAAMISFVLGNFRLLIPFLIILGDVSLGLFVYIKGPTRRVNISFCLTCFFAAIWAFAVFLYPGASSEATALLLSRIASASSSLFPAMFLYFTYVFPRDEKGPGAVLLLFLGAVAAAFSLLSFTGVIVSAVTTGPFGFMYTPGQGFVFYIAYFVGVMSYAFYKLIAKQNEYSGISRMQIRYLLLGFLFGSAFPIVTNIILPLFGFPQLSGFGPFSTIITIAFIAYSIVRHRLMSIELVVQRGIIYGAITIFIVSMYLLAISLSERMFRQAMGYSSFVMTGFAAVIIAILYQPILKALQDTTDRIFFRGHYDYQKTLREASSGIASIIRLDQLTNLIVSTFTETMKVSEISFLLQEKVRRRYRSAAMELKGASRYRKMEIDEGSAIIEYLTGTRTLLLGEEIDSRAQKASNEAERAGLNRLKEEMDRVGISLWVPIILKDELIGLIASGSKLSGEVFTSEDLALIQTLANQTAVALDNARLYEELLSMKTYSEDILQSMTNGVLTTDLRGRIKTFNLMAEKITGYSSKDVVDWDVADIWKEGVVSRTVDGTLRGGNYSNYEASLIKKDGGILPVSISTALLRDSKGKSLGVLAVLTDLSEVKELEGKVRQADKLAALGTMAAGMAHEIKNPLSSMKVLTQLLPKKFSDEEFRARFTEIMPREIGRIDRIVESLLGFARATAPKFELINLAPLIEEALKFYEDDIAKRGIKLVKNFGQIPEIVADSGQLIQVFNNLILNAIQAMPDGGELKITVSEGLKREGVVETVKAVVSDTGGGIPKEFLKKISDPFFTTKHGGTGLGLTIAYSIVDNHRGFIDLESEAGKGAAFTVTLPVTQ